MNSLVFVSGLSGAVSAIPGEMKLSHSLQVQNWFFHGFVSCSSDVWAGFAAYSWKDSATMFNLTSAVR